ncbi:MAG TPA: futalosine hydrolase [Ferruginibacter sp.]|nr:futalosine hydrolase [Ferruginibacter sp.]
MKCKHEICPMQILLLSATEQEIKPFSDANTGTDILVSGVGVPAAMYHLQKRMQQIDYDLIIQAGIAGTFNSGVRLGQVVLVKQDTFADLGAEEKDNFIPLFESGLADKNEFPFTNGWLVNNSKLMQQTTLEVVSAVTVNKVSDSLLQKQQLVKHFNAGIESMEGAALHYICLQENIPFLQLRSVSNLVGERDKTKWKMKEAIDNLNTELLKLIHGLTD